MRRRRKYTWLPTLGTDIASLNDWSGRSFFSDIPDDGSILVNVQPLLPDAPVEGADVTQLQQALEQEYVIERIVGKVHATYIPPQVTDPNRTPGVDIWAAARITVGLFVARANSDPAVGDENVPVGGGTTVGTSSEYNPASVKQIREPWMWRRTWILGNPSFATPRPTPAATDEGLTYPSTNVGYGSVLDGPHMDSKVGRRIGNDDRLWFAMATQGYPVGSSITRPPLTLPSQVRVEFDYRVLGALRKPRNRSAF